MKNRLAALGLIAAMAAPLGAQASTVAAQVAGSVVATVVASAISRHKAPKVATCTLFDRAGNPVTVNCPADIAAANARANGAATVAVAAPAPPVVVAPPPAPVASTTLTTMAGPPPFGPAPVGPPREARPYAGKAVVKAKVELAGGPAAYPAAPIPYAQAAGYGAVGESRVISVVPEPRGPEKCIVCNVVAPPPPPPPVIEEADCGCHGAQGGYVHEEYRDERVYQPRSVASFLSVESSSYSETSYRRLGVVEEYETYGSAHGGHVVSGFASSGAVYGGGAYVGGAAYGGGYAGGVGGPGFYPYGGVGYQAGGYADDPYRAYRARVAGRDPDGFLTWPGKR